MIFERALRRELSHSATGIFIALFAILATVQLVRLLNDAIGGRVAPEAVAALLGFAAIQYLPVLLGLTMFVALFLTLSRHYRDSEMVIWFVSGRSLFNWVFPVLRFAAPIVMLIALLTFFVLPWAMFKSQEFRQNISKRSDSTYIAPGSFREAPKTNRVVFVEKVDTDSGEVQGVFVRAIEQGRVVLVMADHGRRTLMDNGDQFLILSSGRRYELTLGQSELRQVEFASYAVRIDFGENIRPVKATRHLNTTELLDLGGNAQMAELMSRLSLPISAIALALMAIPLAYVNPRGGKSFGVIAALLVFLIYNNLQSVVEFWIEQGRVSFSLAWWPLHALVIVLALFLIWRRVTLRGWTFLWR